LTPVFYLYKLKKNELSRGLHTPRTFFEATWV
jgi:hypothetical protein